MTRILFLTGALVLAGCSSSRPQSDIDRGRQAVIAALDGWKAKDPPEKLKSLSDPVEFTEELRATHTLTDYSLGKIDSTDKDVIRYTVSLSLTDKKGKASEREAVYAVSLRTPIVVARDPYY
jgi:hypothetical protein